MLQAGLDVYAKTKWWLFTALGSFLCYQFSLISEAFPFKLPHCSIYLLMLHDGLLQHHRWPPSSNTHTQIYTPNSELHATAVSAFRALWATMGALVFFNTTSPCDESSQWENKSETETSRHLFVTLETLASWAETSMMDKDTLAQ